MISELKGISKNDKVITVAIEKPSNELLDLIKLLRALKVRIHEVYLSRKRTFFKVVADLYSLTKFLTDTCSITFICVGLGNLLVPTILAILPILKKAEREAPIVLYTIYANEVLRLDNSDLRAYKRIISNNIPRNVTQILHKSLANGVKALNSEEIKVLETLGILKRKNNSLELSDLVYLALLV